MIDNGKDGKGIITTSNNFPGREIWYISCAIKYQVTFSSRMIFTDVWNVMTFWYGTWQLVCHMFWPWNPGLRIAWNTGRAGTVGHWKDTHLAIVRFRANSRGMGGSKREKAFVDKPED